MTESPMIAMSEIYGQHKKSDDFQSEENNYEDEFVNNHNNYDDAPRHSITGMISQLTHATPTNEAAYKPMAKIQRTDIHKIMQSRCFFDAIGTQFNLSIFLYQFFVHIFFPLLYFVENPSAQSVRWTFTSFYWHLLQPVAVYVMVGTYMGLPASDKEILGYSVLLPIVFYVSHRATVALKYASLSPTEYQRFHKCKDVDLQDCYIFQLQLLSGWLGLDALVLYFELGAASSRIGVKINNIYLKLDPNLKNKQALSQLRYWNAFLRGHDFIDVDSKPAPEIKKLPSGELGISVFDMCAAIIRRSNGSVEVAYYIQLLLNVLIVVMIIVLYVPVFMQPLQVQQKMLVATYLMAATQVFWVYGRIFFFFLFVAIVDVSRFNKMVSILHCMIRLTDLMMHNNLTIGSSVVDTCSEKLAKRRADAILSTCENIYSDRSLFDLEVEEEMEQSEIIPTTTKKEENGARDDSIDNDYNGDMRDSTATVLGEKFAENFNMAMNPRIDFLIPDNATAWLYARLTIQHFGERFRVRTDIYISKFSLLLYNSHANDTMFLLAVFTLILMIFMMALIMGSIIMSGDRHAAYSTAVFFQSMIAVTLIVIFMVLIFDIGSKVNDELVAHT